MPDGSGGHRPRLVLIHLADEKSAAWRAAGSRLGMDLRAVRGPVALFVPLVLWNVLTLRKPIACVFRYVNDARWRWLSSIRELGEVFALATCRLLRVRVVWICHNVDRETVMTWPRGIERRRRRLARRAERVLATDPLLVPAVARVFPEAAERLGSVTFGPPPSPPEREDVEAATKRILAFFRDRGVARRGTGSPPREGTLAVLVVGAANEKTLHFPLLPALLDVIEESGQRAVAAVVGPIGGYLRRSEPETYGFLQSDPRVLFIDRYQRLDEERLAPWVSFYFRTYGDQSVPLTVYHAAARGIPLLVGDEGFVPVLVKAHRLGAVVARDLADLPAALGELARYDPADPARFLAAQNWHTGAARLAAACGIAVGTAEVPHGAAGAGPRSASEPTSASGGALRSVGSSRSLSQEGSGLRQSP